jgi:ketosteroid isomerase-like protein
MNTKPNLFILIVFLALAMTACSAATTTPAPTAEPTLAPPTTVPTSTPAPDPAEVVQGFWDALAAGDVDGAMLFVAEDVQCTGSCFFSGTATFRAYIQGMTNRGNITEISDLTVEGDTVTYLYKVLRNGIVVEENGEGESMQVLNGKIILWNNLHF